MGSDPNVQEEGLRDSRAVSSTSGPSDGRVEESDGKPWSSQGGWRAPGTRTPRSPSARPQAAPTAARKVHLRVLLVSGSHTGTRDLSARPRFFGHGCGGRSAGRPELPGDRGPSRGGGRGRGAGPRVSGKADVEQLHGAAAPPGPPASPARQPFPAFEGPRLLECNPPRAPRLEKSAAAAPGLQPAHAHPVKGRRAVSAPASPGAR